MLKLEHTEVLGWEAAIRGMRNPMNSWEKSDSEPCNPLGNCFFACDQAVCEIKDHFHIGPNDLDLMTRLRNAGTDHRKFMRMIAVYVDITGPLYWWKEFDTYKVGTVANSCSTMHKIAAKEFALEDFSCEHLLQSSPTQLELYSALACAPVCDEKPQWTPMMHLLSTIAALNHYRQKYHDAEDPDEAKKYWWQMIQLLPSSYNQKRTVMLNYEVLANIYKSRKGHRLDEWESFRKWIKSLPYSEIITGPVNEGVTIHIDPMRVTPEAFEYIKKVMKEDHRFGFDARKDELNNLKKEIGVVSPSVNFDDSIEHLVDVTCSWDEEVIRNGDRLYEIGPDFTRDDLTPYELQLLKKSDAYRRKWRKKDKE